MSSHAREPNGASRPSTRSGTAWTQHDKFHPADGAGGDWFGYYVGLSGGSVDWYTVAPTLLLTADEPATSWYRWDAGAPVEYVGGFNPPAGTHTLTCWSVDSSGIGSALITWSPVTDAESGIQRYSIYSWNGSTYATINANIPPGSTSYTLTGLTAGSHSIAMQAINMPGYGSGYTSTVEFNISATPGLVVTPIEGATRFETAIAVFKKAFPTGAGSVVIATGYNWPDALGGAALAGALDAIAGVTVERIGGANRYETAIAIATYGVSDAGLEWDRLAIATGQNFPDALAGGVLQGRDESVMLLTPGTTLDAGVSSVLAANRASINEVRFLGSTNAVSTGVRAAVYNVLN